MIPSALGSNCFQSLPCLLPLLLHFSSPDLFLQMLQLACLEQLCIHLLEHPSHVYRQSVNRLAPMTLYIPVQRLENDRKNYIPVLCYQAHYVFVVPEEEGSFCNLPCTQLYLRMYLRIYAQPECTSDETINSLKKINPTTMSFSQLFMYGKNSIHQHTRSNLLKEGSR